MRCWCSYCGKETTHIKNHYCISEKEKGRIKRPRIKHPSFDLASPDRELYQAIRLMAQKAARIQTDDSLQRAFHQLADAADYIDACLARNLHEQKERH